MKNILMQITIVGFSCLLSSWTMEGCTATTAEAQTGDTGESVFSYREIYLPESTGDNAKKLGLNTLDHDWGLWGHNLGDILPEKKIGKYICKTKRSDNP